MNRRSFTQLSAGVAASFIFPSLNCKSPLHQPAETDYVPGELSTMLDRKEINEIGELYRQLHLKESSSEEISRLLLNEEGRAYDSLTNEKSIGEFLANRIKEDFENGDTVEINGWILSTTEARQCAYLSLNP